MALPGLPPKTICFGAFELDATTGELRKAGVTLKLHPQPFQVLVLLVQHAGEMVTREQIREQLWGENTFVDFERGINFCINQIRGTLGDNPEKPRYVETLARRGYRFIAPVKTAAARNAPALDDRISERPAKQDSAATGPVRVAETRLHSSPAATARKGKYSLAAFGLVVVLAAAAVTFYFRRVQASRLTEQDTVVLGDFANSTGDAIFDDTLKQALSVALQQSPFLSILPGGKVRATLKQMTRPADTPLTPEVAREICQRAGSKAYIAGAIGALGSEYVLGLKVVNCQSGRILAQQQATVESKDKVLDALGKSAAKLRAELGESLASVRAFDVPLNQATTSSLEALKEYTIGFKVGAQKGPAESFPYYLRAIQLDPNFAIAYLGAGIDHYNMDQPGKGTEYVTRAFQLRERTSEPEGLEIASDYYSFVTGELDKAAQAYEKTIESYPKRESAYGNLSGIYSTEGQYEKGAELLRQAMRLNPDRGVAYQNLIMDLRSLQRFDEARQTAQAALARKLDTDGIHREIYRLAFLEGNSRAMAEQLAWFESKPDYAYLGFYLQSDTEAYAGHQRKARELARRHEGNCRWRSGQCRCPRGRLRESGTGASSRG